MPASVPGRSPRRQRRLLLAATLAHNLLRWTAAIELRAWLIL
jgi:hypothetical protein